MPNEFQRTIDSLLEVPVYLDDILIATRGSEVLSEFTKTLAVLDFKNAAVKWKKELSLLKKSSG